MREEEEGWRRGWGVHSMVVSGGGGVPPTGGASLRTRQRAASHQPTCQAVGVEGHHHLVPRLHHQLSHGMGGVRAGGAQHKAARRVGAAGRASRQGDAQRGGGSGAAGASASGHRGACPRAAGSCLGRQQAAGGRQQAAGRRQTAAGGCQHPPWTWGAGSCSCCRTSSASCPGCQAHPPCWLPQPGLQQGGKEGKKSGLAGRQPGSALALWPCTSWQQRRRSCPAGPAGPDGVPSSRGRAP